jgi:stress response protein SCP2
VEKETVATPTNLVIVVKHDPDINVFIQVEEAQVNVVQQQQITEHLEKELCDERFDREGSQYLGGNRPSQVC